MCGECVGDKELAEYISEELRIEESVGGGSGVLDERVVRV